MSHYFRTSFELNSKTSVCQSLGDGPFDLERLFFGTHNENLCFKLIMTPSIKEPASQEGRPKLVGGYYRAIKNDPIGCSQVARRRERSSTEYICCVLSNYQIAWAEITHKPDNSTRSDSKSSRKNALNAC
jgi:hypothetical protein